MRVSDNNDPRQVSAGDVREEYARGRRARAVAGVLCMVLGFVLVVGSVLLVVYNYRESDEAGEAAEAVAIAVEEAILPQPVLPVGSRMVPDFILDPERAMPEVEIDGVMYVGEIEIPALDLKLPVTAEWSYPNLKIAPNRYCGTAYQVGFAICAHNYDRHFGRIKTLQTGNEIFFTDMDGYRFGYVVRETEILNPWEADKVLYADWPLTLFTCTIGGRTRVTVRCDRLEGQTGFEAVTDY